jgi:prepilin-type N-terminal cleavage/methylation domain-containing protein
MMKRAFTLIELLIVVAIIAILAAIGLVNFLQAQTRSKVSRTQADMRTFATAIEMYATDRNACPPTLALNKFTTPVAYITQVPSDVFSPRSAFPYLGYIEAVQMSDPVKLQQWKVTSSTPEQRAAFAGFRYFVWSNGPDMVDDAVQSSQQSFYDVVDAPGADYGLFYDPTNGTVSRGDVIRCPRYAR